MVSQSEHLIFDSQQNLGQTLTLVTSVLQNQLKSFVNTKFCAVNLRDQLGSKFHLSEAKKFCE